MVVDEDLWVEDLVPHHHNDSIICKIKKEINMRLFSLVVYLLFGFVDNLICCCMHVVWEGNRHRMFVGIRMVEEKYCI